jgi:hypothetical protein
MVDVGAERQTVHDKFFTADAKTAFEMNEKKKIPDPKAKASGLTLLPKDEEFIKKHLVQISVEGVSALYTEDVPLYFKRIFAETPALRGMKADEQDIVRAIGKGEAPNDEAKKKIPDKAWVVEIRGYTYLDGADQFLMDTLMENLKYPEMVNPTLFPARYAKTMAARGRAVPGNKAAPKKEDLEHEKELDKKVLSETSFLFLLINKSVEDPVPGQFMYIRGSALPILVAPLGDAERMMVAEKGKGGDGGGENNPAPPVGLPKKTRAAWRPIGDVAAAMNGAAGGGRLQAVQPFVPPGMRDKKGPAINLQPRYEFVLQFLWKEPLHNAAAVAAEPAAKKE